MPRRAGRHDAQPMPASTRPDPNTLRLSRRRLLMVGGAGVAALCVPPMGGMAEASTLGPALKRSSWTTLGDPVLVASRDGRHAELRLLSVSDVPVASRLPVLRGHEAAFVLRFAGPAGLPAGIYRLRHAELGAFDLSFGPLADPGRYAAIVDRTVRVAGVDEEGAPVGVAVPADRTTRPDGGVAASTAAAAAGSRSAASRSPARRRRASRSRIRPAR